MNGVTPDKAITRQVFGALPTCRFGMQPDLAAATNYQDLWWNAPAGSESGWGLNIAHQGDTLFVTWFTYDLDGSPLWLSATAQKTGARDVRGTLYRTTGPAFSATPWNPAARDGHAGRLGDVDLRRRQPCDVRVHVKARARRSRSRGRYFVRRAPCATDSLEDRYSGSRCNGTVKAHRPKIVRQPA